MPRSLEARIERLARPLHRRDLAAIWHRRTLRARLKVCTLVRAAVAEAGLDPAGISVLRLEAEALAELAALGDTPALRAADEALAAVERRAGDADELAGRLARLARCHADGSHPPANGSLASWYAWALVRESGPPPTPSPSRGIEGEGVGMQFP